MDYFNNSLPLEIALDILSRAPIETVLDCKLVCKYWRSLVSCPSFSRMHLHRLKLDDSCKFNFFALTKSREIEYFDYDKSRESTTPEKIRKVNLKPPFVETSIVGSCDGLICLAGYSSVRIYNPITREHIMLPGINSDTHEDKINSDTHEDNVCINDVYDWVTGVFDIWTYGFGCVSSTNHYKVVAIRVFSNTEFIEVHVYTLGSGNGWRNLGKFNASLDLYHSPHGVFANGALYWIYEDTEFIFTIDLAEEKCYDISTPQKQLYTYGNRWRKNEIGIFDGFLYSAVWYIQEEGYDSYEEEEEEEEEEDYFIEVWLLKAREKHKSLGWIKEFELEKRRLRAVTKSSHGGLIRINDDLYIYDPNASTWKRLVEFDQCISEIFPHKNTLVSLKELGEEDTEVMQSIETEEKKAVIHLGAAGRG